MFKNFIGFNLASSTHRSNLERKMARQKSLIISLVVSVIVALILWNLPTDSFGIAGLTIVEQRVIAVFAFATLMWLTEAIPSWATSVLIIVILLFTCSTSSLWLFSTDSGVIPLGTLIGYKSLMYTFADPIIMLFLGGFILAIAATKTGLDVLLAKVMLKPFGTNPKFVLLGFILATGVFSMFLSNTATAAMMLTFLTPVLKSLPADGKGKIGLALAIPIGANIGGIATPIGTPPNAIALKYLNDPEGLNMNLGFGQWMLFMLPFALLVLFIAWILLLKLFPFKAKTIELNIEGTTKKDWQSIVVYITFALTILLWVCDRITGVNSNVVAMLPIGVFCACGIITRRDLEEINWSVLWMVAGGFALGVAMQDTGLATHMIESIPFNSWSPLLMIVGSGLLCYALSNFISNTATASLLVPILAVVGTAAAENLASFGGVAPLLIGLAMSASLAMILPISTPPNALAHATGMVEQKDMMRVGLIMGIIGFILGYIMLVFIGRAGLL
ncbi:MAG: SLC13/DASS family transporter [Alphaproteobacteria bacterium]|nr:SLC13/DASS family transporter [Alphaproteobacteria bacterium]